MSAIQPARPGIFQQGLCLLLCLTAWRGPLPVVHDHGLECTDSLKKHCEVFHESGEADGLGLHFHFAMPREVYGDSWPIAEDSIPELMAFACTLGTREAPSERDEIRDTSLSPSLEIAEWLATVRWPVQRAGQRSGSFLFSRCDGCSCCAITSSWLL